MPSPAGFCDGCAPVPRWTEHLTDPARRNALGRAFEALTDEVFHVVRWATLVGFVQYLETVYPSAGFTVTRWVLSVFLFGYIASRFLLRPELRLFPADAPAWLRLLQFAVNFALCFLVFAAVLWALHSLVGTVSDYRALR